MVDRRNRALTRLAAGAAAPLLALALLPRAGEAQVGIPPVVNPSPTQSPTPPDPTPPPPDPDPDPDPSPTGSSSPSPKPKPSASPKPTSSSSPSTGGGGGSGGGSGGGTNRRSNGSGPAVYTGAAAQAVSEWLTREKSPARSTQRLLDLLGQLNPAEEELTTGQIIRGFGRFPVAGYTWYQDDWAAPRYKPYFHLHEGTDLFAQEGTPAIACTDGRILRMTTGSIGGIGITLEGDDGIQYYYGHLVRYAKGLKVGQRVRVGDVIGYVGATGVAKGTYPHVHFEVHPFGGPPINPKPIVDSWLANAERAATQQIVAQREVGALSQLGAARWHLLVDLLKQPADAQPALWPSALDPAGATLGFADLALGRLATSVDWGSGVEGVGATSDEWARMAVALAGDPVARLLQAAEAAHAGEDAHDHVD